MDNNHQELIMYMKAIDDISKSIHFSTNLKAMKDEILQKAMKILQVDAISLLLIRDGKNELYFDVSKGEKGKDIESKRDMFKLKVGQGIAGWVAKMGQPMIINDPTKHPNFYQQVDVMTGYITRNIACVPLIVKNKVRGVIEAINKRNKSFEDVDMVLLNSIATHIAVIIENLELYDEVIHTRNYYGSIIENMPGGLLVMDSGGKITCINSAACRILGVVRAVTEGKPCREALVRQKEITAVLTRTLSEKKIENRLELKTMGKDNHQVTIGYGTIIINDPKGVLVGVGMIFQDLTHIKEIQTRVEKMLSKNN